MNDTIHAMVNPNRNSNGAKKIFKLTFGKSLVVDILASKKENKETIK